MKIVNKKVENLHWQEISVQAKSPPFLKGVYPEFREVNAEPFLSTLKNWKKLDSGSKGAPLEPA